MIAADARPFDLTRAVLVEKMLYPPAHMSTTYPLAELVEGGIIQPSTSLLMMERGEQPLTFSTLQLVYHHVAQGEFHGEPWLVSFCSICNGGAAFSPEVDGRVLHFSASGIYDAMILLADDETTSYWDHLIGLCYHGEMAGKRMRRLSNLLHTSAEKVLSTYPEARIALSNLTPEQQSEAEEDDAWRQEIQPEWSARMMSTLAGEDTRLPRLEMGLGVWNDHDRQYYPIRHLNTADNAIIDRLGDRRILVYVDPATHTPDAFFTDATRVETHRNIIQLNNGDTIRGGGVFTKEGEIRLVERPLQLFSRWYAFAVRFPGCHIYSGSPS
jgi:hypothetical protein